MHYIQTQLHEQGLKFTVQICSEDGPKNFTYTYSVWVLLRIKGYVRVNGCANAKGKL